MSYTQPTSRLGSLIRAARLRLDLSQRQVARILGVTNAAVSWWELKGGPRYDMIIKAARLLNADPEEFLDAHYEDMYEWATERHPEKHFCRLSLAMRGYPGWKTEDTCATFFTRASGRDTESTQEEEEL